MEVCGYVMARAEEGPCETCGVDDRDWPYLATQHKPHHHNDGAGHPYLGPPKEVCGHGLYDHEQGDIPPGSFNCESCGHFHEFVPATRCETCGGTGEVWNGETRWIQEGREGGTHWQVIEPCPDCVPGLVKSVG